MRVEKIIERINNQFETKDNEFFNVQAGITYDAKKEITKIGYATNLTLEVIESANDLGIGLIVTHHDAWSFIGDLKEKCLDLLKKYKISHYFNHLPLDDASFGTNSSLANELGLKQLKKTNEESGFMCGLIGEYDKEVEFNDFRELCEKLFGEKVQAWQFNNRPIKKVHILCGAGHLTTDMAVSLEEGCDLYLTGEKILYSIEYAKLNELNLVVGSHTFTELFGVKSMLEGVELKGIEIHEIGEEHIESDGFSLL